MLVIIKGGVNMGLFRHHNQMPPRIKRKLKQRLLPVAAMEIVVADVLTAKSFRRGHRLGWLLLAFVQPFGPWLYFAFGQER